MAFCLAELHLWSTKRSLQVKDTDIGTHQVYDKAEPAHPLEHHYYHEKLQFCEARGIWWTPSNSRPDKLRDSLKDLEELLQTTTCVSSRWRTKQCCQLMLSNGVLVTLTLNGPQLEHICTDRTLVGRLPASTIAEAVLREHLILLSFKKHSQVAAVYLSRRNQDSPEAGRRTEKLSQSEIQVSCVDMTKSGLHQHLALNCLHDMAVCWWNWEDPGGETWPWSATDKERDNLVLLSCSHDKNLKTLNSLFTEDKLLDCCFSSVHPYQLLTVEIPAGPQGALTGGRMGHGEFLQQRLRCGQVREAVHILEAMNWATMEDECFRGLSSVVNFLLRLPLNAEREALLEAALGVFYAPAAPLTDTVTLEYREPVSKYARRFFHHLLRHQRFEKAFLLALDLERSDLFMDLHYVARDKGEEVLADVAKRKAKEMEARVTAADGSSHVCDSRNQGQSSGSVPSDPGPSYTSARVGGRTNRILRRPDDITVTVNPEVFRTLIQADQNSSDPARERVAPRRPGVCRHVISSLPAGGANGDAGDRNERVTKGGSIWFPQTTNPGDLRLLRVVTCGH
ncbi:WD repeat-containing and planar cell polarity effector protein fritz homolog isoform X5 [Synchiropus splendidus]|uniref:WD repeat-containing and planar cell polarity effector protein fritz homolog isoform X5 n=1 Tax=Synchiropus splendidus TaxID=270530 RepID=UPI00237EB911|nr:WD repeat-containing and planar cell polarity effector protein fritz homolog isoform X5 [Synchiropus splendidus]